MAPVTRKKKKQDTKDSRQTRNFRIDAQFLYAEEEIEENVSDCSWQSEASDSASASDNTVESETLSDNDEEETEDANTLEILEEEGMKNNYFDVDMQEPIEIDRNPDSDDDYITPNVDDQASRSKRDKRKKRLIDLKKIQQHAQPPEDAPGPSRESDSRISNQSESEQPSTSTAVPKKKAKKLTKKRKKKELTPEHDFPLGRATKEVKWEEGAKKEFNFDFNPERPMGPSPETVGKTPIELFDIIWEDLFPILLHNTNIKGNLLFGHLKQKKWKPIIWTEMQLFIGILLSMGLNPKRRVRDYWKKDSLYGCHWYNEKMSRDRFEKILAATTFVENAIETMPGGSGNVNSRNFSTSWKIDPLMNNLIRKFEELYYPGIDLCIDEIMIKFTGRFTWRQTIPRKPIKTGIKLFALNCGKTNYLLNFIPYMAQKFIRDSESTIFANVWALINGENVQGICDFTGRGFRNDTDSYYTMVGATDTLANSKVWTCSTITKTRGLKKEHVADSITLPDGSKRKMERGEVKFFTDEHKKIQLMVWKDNKIVTILCTIPEISTDMVTAQRKVIKRKNKRKITSSRTVTMPEIVAYFNKAKSATDYFNENVASNHKDFKSRDWTRPFIIWCFEASLVNAMIISNENDKKLSNDENYKPKWNNRNFRKSIVDALVTRAEEAGVFASQPIPTTRNNSQSEPELPLNPWMAPRRLLTEGVQPREKPRKLKKLLRNYDMKPIRLNRKILHTPGKGHHTNRCIVHKQSVKTNFVCLTCQVPLCMEQCWMRWHKHEDYLYDDPFRAEKAVIRISSSH